MGAVDLVIQVESPKSVARGLQRIGRAGHELHAVSKGRIFPKFRADLLESAVVARAMREGEIEETRIPRNPLDVLAQQIVAICADEEIAVDDLHELVARAYPFADLSRAQLENVLDMLAGRYPSDEFAELRPRIVWDRTAGVDPRARRARGGSRSRTRARSPTAASSASSSSTAAAASASSTRRWSTRRARARRSCSAPRPGGSRRSRATACSSRRRPGVPGAVPFWKGEGVGRPSELGEKIGARLARARRALGDEGALERLRERLPARRARGAQPARPSCASRRPRPAPSPPTGRSWSSASATRSATGASASSRRSAAACTRRGRWRSRARLRDVARPRRAVDLVGRRDRAAPPRRRRAAADRRPADRARTRSRTSSSPSSAQTALFGARFRENAARALLIPRRRPGQRTPLWQQRLKAQSLLQVARRYGSFPIVLETYRECLQDVFDLPALRAAPARPADARARPRRGRDGDGLAVRVVAALRLRRDLHVRGRHAAGRAACAGALARPRPAARAARPGGAARPARPRRARARSSAQLRGAPRNADELHDLLRLRGDLRDGEYDAGARRAAARASGVRSACASPARSG